MMFGLFMMTNPSIFVTENIYDGKHGLLEASTKRLYNVFQKKFDEDDHQLKKDLQRITELQILNEQKINNQS